MRKQADAGEIRAAWRRAAFEAHPDRNQGEERSFARVQAAYQLLSNDDAPEEVWTAFTAGTASRPGVSEPFAPSKPKVVTRILPLQAETIATCRALLVSRAESQATDAAAPAPARGRTTDHVPAAVAVHGRSLTFHIATPLVRGVNRIALPTAVLHDKSMKQPDVITFRSPASGAGEIAAPDTLRESLFPGARSVRFRFRDA